MQQESPKIDVSLEVSARLELAVGITREAGDGTLELFRRPDLVIERKADASPVTAADRNAEEMLRQRIAERFPDDSVLGEEFGAAVGTTAYQWILDPIDGTKSFIHGVPLYTTLVAVLADGVPQLGVIYAPACGEMVYAAIGGGCWYVASRGGISAPIPAKVSSVKHLRESLLLTSEIASFSTGRRKDARSVYLELERSARLARTWGDGYGYLMVATGRAEVMIDPKMSLWDAASLQPILEEAGGSFTNWRGEATVHSGEAVATNGHVAAEVLAIATGH